MFFCSRTLALNNKVNNSLKSLGLHSPRTALTIPRKWVHKRKLTKANPRMGGGGCLELLLGKVVLFIIRETCWKKKCFKCNYLRAGRKRAGHQIIFLCLQVKDSMLSRTRHGEKLHGGSFVWCHLGFVQKNLQMTSVYPFVNKTKPAFAPDPSQSLKERLPKWWCVKSHKKLLKILLLLRK